MITQEQIDSIDKPATLEETIAMLTALQITQSDLKLLKDTIYLLLKKIGLVNDDGSFREGLNVRKMSGLLMELTMNKEKFMRDMEFLQVLKPLIEKYQNL
jgi:hypothetical protein